MHFTTTALTFLATFALTSASAVLPRGVNDICGAQPAGNGPAPYKTTAVAFQKFGTFSTLSTTATAPPGFLRSFHNQLAATSGTGYMGLYTLSSYSASDCGDLCTSSQGCQGFNVFFERDPSLNPAPSCANPAPTTSIKCTLWSQPPTSANVTNSGEVRQQFQVVIAGSSGYAKLGSVPANTQDYGVNPYS
jgi:hypothetical protein